MLGMVSSFIIHVNAILADDKPYGLQGRYILIVERLFKRTNPGLVRLIIMTIILQ